MSLSPTSIPTDIVRRHFTESCKNIYWKCHNHRRLYRQIQSVGISQRVAKIFTGNATITGDSTDGYSPSAFVGSSKLLIKSPTDGVNSKERVLMHL